MDFYSDEQEMFDSVFAEQSRQLDEISSGITTQNAYSLQNAKDKIQSLTTDEFLIEAYNAATQLRNTLGDADALVSELSETIRMNILVVAMLCHKHPTEIILSAARTMSAQDKSAFLSNSIEMLLSYQRSIESETLNDN